VSKKRQTTDSVYVW